MTRSRFQRAAAAVSLGTTALLLACGGGGGGSGGPITVSGTVVDATGAPVSAANVLLNGDGTTLTTTGVEGKFSYAEVKPPYSLTVKSGPAVFEYRGLTRTAPRIVASTAGESHVVQVSGTVTGPTMPLGPNDSILLGATDGVLAAGDANPNTGKYTVGLRWTQGAFKATDVAALHITGTSTGITAYHQTGKRTDVTLQDGVSLVGVDVALDTAVTTHSTVLSYSLGAYSTMGHGGYGLLDANGARYFVENMDWNLPAGATVLMPDGGGTLGVIGFDADGNQAIRIGTAVLGGTTGLDLPASTVLETSLPASGAVGVSRTPILSWTPVAGADLYVVGLQDAAHLYWFVLPGGTSTLAFPDYSVLGVPLSGGTPYVWYVNALVSSGLTADSIVDPASGGLTSMLPRRASAYSLYGTKGATFTTAP